MPSQQPQIKFDISRAFDTEVFSNQALKEMMLDDGGGRRGMLSSNQQRNKRRSSVNSNMLMIKQDGPSIGFKVLSATLTDLHKRLVPTASVEVSPTSAASNEDIVASWFVCTKSTSTLSQTKPDQVEPTKDPELVTDEAQKKPSRGFLYTVLATEQFKTNLQRQRAIAALSAGKDNRSMPAGKHSVQTSASGISARAPRQPHPSPRYETVCPVPSLERVQEHIARVKTLVGQTSPVPTTTTSPFSPRSTSPEKKKLSVFLEYRAPFPALKRRRDNAHQREKYILSLIKGRG